MAERNKDELSAGTPLGQYEVVRLIGAGGMGSIYEGRHVALKKRVAIKVLAGNYTEHVEARARFVREGEAAARIAHPNVVEVFDVGINEQNRPYLVMEFLQGEDIAALLAREGALPITDAIDLLFPVISAVSAAHGLGVLHRDLKPDNVFLASTHDGGVTPKLLDFGISKLEGGAANHALTRADAFLGTPFYVAPEQAQGGSNATSASDQYSLGVIAYEMFTGKRPFGGDSLYEVLHAIVEGRFEPPTKLRPELPQALGDVVCRAMATVPSERFETVHAFGRALLPFASEDSRAVWQAAFDDEHPRVRREGTGRFALASVTPSLSRSRGVNVSPAAPAVPNVALVRTTLSDSAGEVGDELRLPSASPIPWIAAAAVVLLLGAGGAYFALRSGSTRGPTSATQPAVPVAATIAVAITADPPNATFLLDGRPAGSRKLTASLPRNGRAHEVLVMARGYETSRIGFTDEPPPTTVRLERVAELPLGMEPPVGVPTVAGPAPTLPNAEQPVVTGARTHRRGRDGAATTAGTADGVGSSPPVSPPTASPTAVVVPPVRPTPPPAPVVDVGANNAAIVD